MNSILLATSLAFANPDIQIEKEEMTVLEKQHKKRKMRNIAYATGFIILGNVLIFAPLYVNFE